MDPSADFPCQKYWWYLPLSFGIAAAIVGINTCFIPERELNARFFFNASFALLECLLFFWLVSLVYLSLLYLVQKYASRRRSYWIASAVYWLLTAAISWWICVGSQWELIRAYDAGELGI